MTATEQLMMTKDMSRMTTTTVIKDKSKFPLYLFGEFILFLGFMFMMDNLSSNLMNQRKCRNQCGLCIVRQKIYSLVWLRGIQYIQPLYEKKFKWNSTMKATITNMFYLDNGSTGKLTSECVPIEISDWELRNSAFWVQLERTISQCCVYSLLSCPLVAKRINHCCF